MGDFEEELARVKAKRNPYADWRDSSVKECNRYMLHNQVNCDVILRAGENFGDTYDFGCHKYILMSRSSVFTKMLNQKLDAQIPNGINHHDKVNGKVNGDVTAHVDINGDVYGDIIRIHGNMDDVIELPDVDTDGIYELLRYLYYDEADVDDDNVFAIYHAALKFHIRPLEERCKQYIRENYLVTSENVCGLLETSVTFLCHFLTSECVTYIDANPRVCATEEFKSMSKPALDRVYHHINNTD